jgi:hypothetical protein
MHCDGHTPLISLLSNEIFPVQAETVLRLLEFGADASGIDNNGNGAFHHAMGIMNTTNCERLIESLHAAGANINIKNYQGKTPSQVMDVGVKGLRFPGLPWILGKFNDKLFSALLIAGADPELRDTIAFVFPRERARKLKSWCMKGKTGVGAWGYYPGIKLPFHLHFSSVGLKCGELPCLLNHPGYRPFFGTLNEFGNFEYS